MAPATMPFLVPDRSTHLGGENLLIARSLLASQRFADPFGYSDQPTAWVPPVFPALIAVVLLITQDIEKVGTAFVLAQMVVVAFGCYLVLRESQNAQRSWLGCIVVVIFLSAYFPEIFQMTHDTWLVMLCVNLIWLLTVSTMAQPWQQLTRVRSIAVGVRFGILGGFVALCSPAVGGAWAAVTLAGWVQRRLTFSVVATAAVVSMLLVAPWIVRNRIVLGGWFPIKSNAGFELWQSQVADDDGVLDGATLSSHPWSAGRELALEHTRIGEAAFVRRYMRLGMDHIVADPREYVRRALNRARAAFLSGGSVHRSDPSHRWQVLVTRSVHWLPLLGILFVCACRRRLPWYWWVAPMIVLVTLLPYVLISYYERYGAPHVFLKSIIVGHAAMSLFRMGQHDTQESLV